MKQYAVNEIFSSLQGEGYYTGTAALFLRFSGCNLECDFCDTDHHESTMMTLDEIMQAVSVARTRHIVITGGEPSLQLDAALVDALHADGWYIQIETNGTNPVPDDVDWITCSPKAAGNLSIQRVNELKIVYTGRDVEAIADIFPTAEALFLQPCSCSNTAEVIDYIMEHPWWRLSLQTHKLTGIR